MGRTLQAACTAVLALCLGGGQALDEACLGRDEASATNSLLQVSSGAARARAGAGAGEGEGGRLGDDAAALAAALGTDQRFGEIGEIGEAQIQAFLDQAAALEQSFPPEALTKARAMLSAVLAAATQAPAPAPTPALLSSNSSSYAGGSAGEAAGGAALEQQAVAGAVVVSMTPDANIFCVQGDPAYISKAVSALKVSILASVYRNTQVSALPCFMRGFVLGPSPDGCFPKAQLFFDPNPLNWLAAASLESSIVQSYAASVGQDVANKAMKAVCDR